MKTPDPRRIHYFHLVAFVVAGGLTYFFRTRASLQLDPALVLQAGLSGAGLSFLAVVALERWLWHLPPVRLVLNIQVPRLNGRWLGAIRSSYTDHSVEYPIVLEIRQDLNEISITYFDERAVSVSQVAGFSIDRDSRLTLLYIYRNEPFVSDQTSLQIHYGTVLLHYEQSPAKRLHGTYYNNQQQRPTYGSIDVRFETTKLANHF